MVGVAPVILTGEFRAFAVALPRQIINADEAGTWDNLYERFEVKQINSQETFGFEMSRGLI